MIRLLAAIFLVGLPTLFSGCDAIPTLDRQKKPQPLPPAVKRENLPQKSAKPEMPPAGVQAGLRYNADVLADEDRSDRVLARVDGHMIRASDLFQIFLLKNPMKMREVVQNLVLYELARKEALRLGIEVPGAKVEELLEIMLEDHQGRLAMEIDKDLKLADFVQSQYGMEMAEYREVLRKTALFQLMLERNVRYYELGSRRHRIGLIVLKDRELAQETWSKLKRGASFEVLAREHSVDRSRSLGGILPPLPADMEYPVVMESRALEQGQLSEVQEAELGGEKVFRIIKLVEVLEPAQGSYLDLESQVEASLEEDPVILPEVLFFWLESMKKRYEVSLDLF